jgi:hypothetical protein
MEHTQMHVALKKDTKVFHYTSNSCGILLTIHRSRISLENLIF